MLIGPGVDQLRVNANTVGRTLNTAFQHMRNAKLLTNLAEIARDPGFINA